LPSLIIVHTAFSVGLVTTSDYLYPFSTILNK